MTLQDVPKWFDIFGPEAHGATIEERAASSSVRFVRSQDQMAEWTPPATGRQYTAREVLAYFGADFLKQLFFDEALVLPSTASEPAKTLRERREAFGFTRNELAKIVKLPEDIIIRAESPDYSNDIHHINKIAIALGLDDYVIGYVPGANGDPNLAVRLKEWRQAAKARGSSTVARFAEIAWVIAKQHKLQQHINPSVDLLADFTQSDDYGDPGKPVWEVAADLAAKTRETLGLSWSEPIMSLRDVCYRLSIPLIHAELNTDIAGATLANGNVRGIVANVDGNNGNVWVQRATVAHELGHLLWDPAEKLNLLITDSLTQIEVVDRKVFQMSHDWVEARANAFAVELLAPKEAVRENTPHLDIKDPAAIATAIRDNMEHFGLSATAMRYHLWNAFDRRFDINSVFKIDPEPTDEWKGREAYTDDFFVLKDTPLNRRGHFAGVVAKAEEQKWLTAESAAFYLNATTKEYAEHRVEILGLYAV